MFRRIAVASVAVAVSLSLTAFTNSMNAPRVESARFHLALKRAEPAKNDTVTASPKTISLWFTESVTPAATSIRVMAGDRMVKISDVTVEAAALSPAVVSVNETLAAGTYTVMWRAASGDGHPVNGKFGFTVR